MPALLAQHEDEKSPPTEGKPALRVGWVQFRKAFPTWNPPPPPMAVTPPSEGIF
jgi:hypothetical protein